MEESPIDSATSMHKWKAPAIKSVTSMDDVEVLPWNSATSVVFGHKISIASSRKVLDINEDESRDD